MDVTDESIQRTSYVDSEIRIVLLGKTGAGKSTLGNLIVGEKVFESSGSFWSCTHNCQQKMFEYEGQSIQIVDTPGFSDTEMDETCLTNELRKCLELTSPGIHAVLYTIRIGRFTQEDQQVLDKFLNMFGKAIIDHVIVIFTGKDDLDRSGKTFEDMKGDERFDPGLKKVLDDCKERYVVLDATMEGSRDDKVQEILTKTKQLNEANGSRNYTNEMFLHVEVQMLIRQKKILIELIAKEKEDREKKMLETETRLRLETEIMKLSRDEAEKKIKDEILKKEKAYELEMQARARREVREGIITGVVKSIVGLIGSKSVQTVIGGLVAGTVGAAIGGAAGVGLVICVGGYLASKIGEASVPTSQTSEDQTDNASVNRVVP